MILKEMIKFIGKEMIELKKERMDKILKRLQMIERKMEKNKDQDKYVKIE